ncbi:MAG: FG-GAP repeat protein [Gammaproteobacteria bacterium]
MFGLLGAGLCLIATGFAPAYAAASADTAGTLPEGLRPAIYQTLVGATQAQTPLPENGCTSLENQGLKACFGSRDARFTTPGAQALSLRLAAFGRGAKLVPVGAAERVLADGRVSYRYAALTEWWRMLPTGYEQGFTIERRPAGAGLLTLALNANRSPRRYGESLGWGRLRYGGLAVTDATGRRLAATLDAHGSLITIATDDRGAKYPLTVDPLVWVPQVVRAPSVITTSRAALAPAPATSVTVPAAFGAAVAFSGGTAFLAAPFTSVVGNTQQGMVFVFSEAADRTWSESAMLTADDGASYDQFGSTLALSGTNLLIGAPGATVGGNTSQGAAYVFANTGGVWSQTQKLTASDGAAGDEFGGALAISGTEALVGARTAAVGGNTRAGAVYAFNDTGGVWGQTQKLTASDGAAGDLFGSAFALDGAAALVGAPAAHIAGDAFRGAAYVFADTGGVWSQTQKLTASDGATGDQFGSAFALEGTTALVGAPFADVSGQVSQGKVYAFTANGGSWSETQKLTTSDGATSDEFGSAMAIDGANVLIGGEGGGGKAYLFNNGSGSWTQSMEFASGGAGYGRAVALEGLMALVGSPNIGAGANGGNAIFYINTNLSLTLDAPADVQPGKEFPNDFTLTNNTATASPPLTLATFVPDGATYISAIPTQGECIHTISIVCDLGQVAGNGGTASLNAKYKVTTTQTGVTIQTSGLVVGAVPGVTASGATKIEGGSSSGGGGAFGLGLLILLGLLAGTTMYQRRRAVRVKL